MDNPTITYDELKAALDADACWRNTEPALYALLDKLNPTPSLLGRWATHKEYGRGIIVSIQPDSDGEVRFAYRNSSYTDAVNTRFVRPESLTLDPATLTTAEDFKDAPNYTIAEDLYDSRYVAVKVGGLWYRAGDATAVTSEETPACRVIRWGNGQ